MAGLKEKTLWELKLHYNINHIPALPAFKYYTYILTQKKVKPTTLKGFGHLFREP